MQKPKFEMLKGRDGKIYIHLKASNGEIILSGRGYDSKSEAIHAIGSVMRYGAMGNRFRRRESINGQHYFQLPVVVVWLSAHEHHRDGGASEGPE